MLAAKKAFSFFGLKVYEQSVRFSGLVWELSLYGDKQLKLWEMIKTESMALPQLIAYATTFTHDEKKACEFRVARGVCFKLVPLFELGHRKGLFTETNWEVLLEELESLSRKLTNLIAALEESQAKGEE